MAQAFWLLLESSICLSDAIQQRYTACTAALQKGLALGHKGLPLQSQLLTTHLLLF